MPNEEIKILRAHDIERKKIKLKVGNIAKLQTKEGAQRPVRSGGKELPIVDTIRRLEESCIDEIRQGNPLENSKQKERLELLAERHPEAREALEKITEEERAKRDEGNDYYQVPKEK